MKPDGIQRGGVSYPGKARPVLSLTIASDDRRTPFRRGDLQSEAGTAGGRFTGSTDESVPMKPGNRVEEKTLRIRKGEAIAGCKSTPLC